MRTERLVREVNEQLLDSGLQVSIVVRDLETGEQISMGSQVATPAASLAKIPLALAVLEQVRTRKLDGTSTRRVEPGLGETPGIGRFLHPVFISVDDLVSLALTVSDDAAADELLKLVPPSEVMAYLASISVEGITVRHEFCDLSNTPLERFDPDDAHLAQTLAIRGTTPARGHPVRQLDITRANTGTAAAWADLLQAVWLDRGVHPTVAAQVRRHMHGNVFRQRLAPDFISDSSRWASKTGTVLNLRHEIGVVEHVDGSRFVVIALSTSLVPASEQPAAEAALAAAARRLHDELRSSLSHY